MNEPKKTYVAGNVSAASFTNGVLIIAAVVALSFIVWRLSHVFILVFAGIVFSMVLRAMAEPVARATNLPHRWALVAVGVPMLTVLALGGWLMGERVVQQFDQVWARLPDAWARAQAWLEQSQFGRFILEGLTAPFVSTDKASSGLAKWATSTFGALGDAAIIIMVGIFIASEPAVYRRGLITLVPPSARERVNEALDAVVHSLKRWLMGQSLAMLSIGVMTGIGLWALGIPMALALAILAGLLEFIPYIGPLCAAVPAILLAFAQSPMDALYVLILYAAVQEFEGWALIPLLEKWTVKMPPVLTILAVVIFGLMFGIPGIVVAAPLMIVVVVLVRKLYVEGTLGDKA